MEKDEEGSWVKYEDEDEPGQKIERRSWNSYGMKEDCNGNWVSYEDHFHAVKEIKNLVQGRAQWQSIQADVAKIDRSLANLWAWAANSEARLKQGAKS